MSTCARSLCTAAIVLPILIATAVPACANQVTVVIRNHVSTPNPINLTHTEMGGGDVNAALALGTSHAFGAVSPSSGELKARSSNAPPSSPRSFAEYIQSSTAVILAETLTFPVGSNFSAAFSILLHGYSTATGFTAANGDRPFANGSLAASATVGSRSESRTLDTRISCDMFQPTCLSASEEINGSILVPFTIDPLNRTLNLFVRLSAGAVIGASADFGNTAFIRFVDLPEGVIYTSSSGVFLSAVPEPGTMATFLGGFLALVLSTSIRARKAAQSPVC